MPAIGMSTSSSVITGSASPPRSPRRRLRLRNRSRLRRPPRLSSSSARLPWSCGAPPRAAPASRPWSDRCSVPSPPRPSPPRGASSRRALLFRRRRSPRWPSPAGCPSPAPWRSSSAPRAAAPPAGAPVETAARLVSAGANVSWPGAALPAVPSAEPGRVSRPDMTAWAPSPGPDFRGLSGSIASCSRRRGAPAPAGAPRVAEWLTAALAVAERTGPAAGPPCRLWIASMSWLLRIRPTPVMPMDWATRCSSGSSMLVSARPGARAGGPAPAPSPDSGDTGAGAVTAAVPDRGSGRSDRGASPGRSRVPAKNSVGSLTRGPSKKLRRRPPEPVRPGVAAR